MSLHHLSTYLNDHLAGAALAIHLTSHLSTSHPDAVVRSFAQELEGEITADRKELESLMGRLEVGQSLPRKTSAWIAEKLTRVKFRIDDSADGPFRLLEAMELLSVGIEGKRLLWLALSAAKESAVALQAVDFDRLIRRAEDQRSRVEKFRVTGARQALVPTS